jgi:PAS domain S-box-containing protein
MKTVIVGGGRGCRAILELLAAGHLRELALDVVAVADLDDEAPGIAFARERGIATLTDYREALAVPDLRVVIELTSDHDLLDEIYHRVPAGVRVIDHESARIFWDLINIERQLKDELRLRAALEEELANDRERMQGVLDALPDIVIVLDPDKRVRMTNRRFSLACGVDPADAVGKGCRDIFCTAGSDPHADSCPFDEAVQRRRPVSRIIERQPPNQGFFEVTACPQFDRDGRLAEVVETHHPVTERILLQREVERSERTFRQFIEQAQDIISIKDRNGRYLVVNPMSAGLFDLQPADCVGKTAAELYEPEVARTIYEHDRLVMESREHASFDETYRINGREYQLEVTRFPIFDYNGEVDGVCTIARDVTEQRRLQTQVLQSAKLAAVGKLAAGVAHEINNPLTGILAYAEDLRDDAGPSDERREDYEVIVRETLRCRSIVRNLLDFARQESPIFQTADLREVVTKTLPLVERLPRFHDIGLQIEQHASPLPVDADSRQLQQVLLNLLMNAVEAMDGVGRLRVQSYRRADRGVIAVADSGPGIPVQDRARIFEPFYSTKATAGLGLSLSWSIVERHDGALELGESELGGAEFRVVLPLVSAEREECDP